MPKFRVCFRLVTNGTVEVESENQDLAADAVRQILTHKVSQEPEGAFPSTVEIVQVEGLDPSPCLLCGEDRNHPSQHGNHSC